MERENFEAVAADAVVRTAALAFARRARDRFPEGVPYSVLAEGLVVGGRVVKLIGPNAIFRPAGSRFALTVLHSPSRGGPTRNYADGLGRDGLYRYAYQSGGSAAASNNASLRACIEASLPVLFLMGLGNALYDVVVARVVGDDPAAGMFALDLDVEAALGVGAGAAPLERAYRNQQVLHRVHGRQFRERVLTAYANRCAVCSLRRRALLDAAHILPDKHERGDPVVTNGLGLCRLHHAAYDANEMGIRPDCTVEIRRDVMEDSDGPVLRHALQEVDGRSLLLPRRPADRPDRDRLAERYDEFRRAG